MSNFQAVATVTAALRNRLLETLQTDVPSVTNVTTLRPADPGTAGIPQVGANLFLFAVHINAAQRNRDLPVRRSSGEIVQTPVIPLDLDYLVSFYGDANDVAHQLVGSVMRSLYARPILTAAMIAAVEGGAGGLNSGLADQLDRVRFTPLPLPIEEMSKLWSVFFQTSYALSVAFRAGPVLIEADVPLVSGLPVATTQITVAPVRQPSVTAVVLSGAAAAALITPGSAVDILGSELSSGTTTVVLGGQAVSPSAVAETKVTVTLPATLPAGAQGVQIRQDVLVGTPPAARPGTLSNLATFVLHPVVTQTGGAYAIAVAGETGTGAALRAATVSVGLTPVVGAAQTATLELLDLTGVVQAVFREAAGRSAAASTIAYPISGIAAGAYVLRARVDGAETPVVQDTVAASPTFGQLIPQVVFA